MSDGHLGPDVILDIATAYIRSRTLLSGHDLGIFRHLAEGSADAFAVSRAIHADAGAIEILLDALSGMGLLDKRGSSYGLSHLAATYLVPGQPGYIGDTLGHNSLTWKAWAPLDQVVRAGKADPPSGKESAAIRTTLLCRHVEDSLDMPQLLSIVQLREHRILLELGGAPGTHAIAFCHLQPDLRATVLDHSAGCTVAAEVIAQAGLGGRIRLLAGDPFLDPLGGPYDVVVMPRMLLRHGKDRIRLLLRRVADELLPGGLLVIRDYILESDGTTPLGAVLASLGALVEGSEGRSHRFDELKDLLEQSDFVSVRWQGVGIARGMSLVIAERA